MAGKLNGVMPATTPSGCRIEYTSTPVEACSVKPPFSRCGMPQANSTFSRPRATSPIASESTLPCSARDERGESLRCSSTSSRMRNMISARFDSEVARQPGSASRGRVDRPVDLLHRCEVDLVRLLAGRRVEDRPGAARLAGHLLAADPVAYAFHVGSSFGRFRLINDVPRNLMPTSRPMTSTVGITTNPTISVAGSGWPSAVPDQLHDRVDADEEVGGADEEGGQEREEGRDGARDASGDASALTHGASVSNGQPGCPSRAHRLPRSRGREPLWYGLSSAPVPPWPAAT